MNLSKDQLLALMNTIDYAIDNDASYEEYTIIRSGTADLEPIRDILYNEYRAQDIMRTKNKIALESLIDNINHIFYYVGAKGDDVDQFEIDQLHRLVDEFASEVTISDSQGE